MAAIATIGAMAVPSGRVSSFNALADDTSKVTTDTSKAAEVVVPQQSVIDEVIWVVDNREGIRVSFDRDNGDGWFLLRLSVHDPIMPLNVESDSEGGVKIICDKLGKFLKTTTGLDL